MNRKIKLSQGIKYGIIGLALLLFWMISNFEMIQNYSVSKSNEVQMGESGPISVASNGIQMFLAEGKELEAVELYVLNDMRTETITFRIHDSNYQQLWETFHVVKKSAKVPGFVRIPVEMELEEGKLYFYTVEGLTADLYLAYEDTSSSDSIANGTFLYGGKEIPGCNIITRYVYKAEPAPWMIWGCKIALCVGAAVLYFVVDKLFKEKLKKRDREITVQKMVQWIGNPLLLIVVVIAFWSVFPGKMFGVGILNYGFYYLGILLSALVLFFGINYKRKDSNSFDILKNEVVTEKLPQWLMAICFAKILWSCYEYMNGLYDIHHTWATCKILTWLGLVFLCTLKKEEWMKIWNLVYLIPAAVAAYLRYKPFVGLETEEAITGRLQVKLVFVAGFVALQVLFSMIQLIFKKRKVNGSWSYLYLGIFAVVMALMIVFRNTREWPVIAAFMFGVFYYRMWLWEKRNCLMQIFCNGIILNFIYMVYYCFMHRPYHRFRYNRFSMGFHTVTMTGYYLALVLCAVMVCLFAKYYRTKRWQDCWKELSLLGIANAYLIMTLSRTGYLAALVMEIFMCVFFVILKEKKKVSGIVKKFAIGMAVSVLCFPMVFTAQRILPAVVNEPVYSEVEIWDYTVQKGEAKDSELYIDITAFVKVALNKLLGMDTGNISLTSVKPVYVTSDSVMVASEAERMEDIRDVSSGRVTIFREYIKEWNLTGHEDMAFELPNGDTPAHAHNSFLQVIHDHGLITGVLFFVFGVLSFLLSIRNYSVKKQEGEAFYNALPISVIVAFAFAGMVEWIFHFANPMGFSLFVVIIPLLFRQHNGEKNEK